MAKDITKVLIKLDDETSWNSIIESSEERLVIVDIHQDWCGYCEAIHPTLARLFVDYDDADTRMAVASASIQKLGAPVIQATFPSESHINLEKNGCIPLFALYRFKTCVSVIVGVDAPALLQQVALNIPEKPKAAGEE